MSDRVDDKLEAMLRSRPVEAASSDLAERISLQAQNLPQRQRIHLTSWLKDLFAEFQLRRPAYVLACTLLLGFAIGISAPVDTPRVDSALYSDGSDTIDVQSFLYADEDLL